MMSLAREKLVVPVAGMQVSDDSNAVLVTYGLGSCIALTLYDPLLGIGGMLHAQLPLSSMDRGRAEREPCLFADTGVCALLTALYERSAARRRLVAKLAGAASINDDGQLFRIGQRNYSVVRKVLWKNDILIRGEDVGGTASRNLSLCLTTGQTTVKIGCDERDI